MTKPLPPELLEDTDPDIFPAWKERVEGRLLALDLRVGDLIERSDDRLDRLEGKLDDIVPSLLDKLTRPAFMERCGKWGAEIATLMITRLTAPDAIKWTAMVLIVSGVLIAGATFQGWGITIGR